MSKFVSSKIGPIESTYFWGSQTLALECPTVSSKIKDRFLGFGLDRDFSTAMIKALAEALERYTLIYAKEHGVLLYKKTCKEIQSLGYTCFYPDYNLYEDFVYEKFFYCRQVTPTLKTDWVSVTRFSDNHNVWIPASLIYANNYNTLTNILKSPTTNGMACSFFDSAVEDSILELIERDTFMYMWLAKSPGEELLFDKVHNKLLIQLLDIIGCKMKQIKVILKYTDIRIPCIYVLFKGEKDYNEPAFIISGNADPDIERGCYRALLEFIASYNLSRRPHRKEAVKKMEADKFPKINTFPDRGAFYSIYEHFPKCEFLFDVNDTKRISDLYKEWNIEEKAEFLKTALKEKSIFIANVTPKEIIKSDVRVIRSYSPDLLDLEHGENELFNFSFKKKRIDEINVFDGKTSRLNVLNSDPHCYP